MLSFNILLYFKNILSKISANIDQKILIVNMKSTVKHKTLHWFLMIYAAQ